MSEHNKTYYSLEELKRARDCYEGYQDGEEVYYFVGALRYACDEIERLNNEIKTLLKENGNKEKVIIAQDNIIKELEKWLESEIDRIIKLKSPKRRSIPPYGAENFYYDNMILRYKEVLDKLKELKESDKE